MRFLFRSLTGLFLFSVTIGLLALAGNSLFDAVQERRSQEDRRPVARERIQAVNVHVIEVGDVTPVLAIFGEVGTRRTLDIRASASGTILELAPDFEEGGRVDAGQLLARIDPADAQAALNMRQTDMNEAQAGVNEAERALSLAQDDLATAIEQEKLRQAALARAIDLQKRGVGTAASVEAAELSLSSSKQAVLSRRQSLANAESQLDRAKTTMARQEINLAEAERALAETEIYADFAGTLSGVSVVKGGIVTNNERLAQVVDTNALEVSFRVSTAQYIRLLDANGGLQRTNVSIEMDVLGSTLTTSGTITRESAVVGDGQTGRLLFAQLDEARGLRPGDFVRISIQEPQLQDVARLPATAIGSDNSVLVIGDEDRLTVEPVEILRRQKDDVIVAGGKLSGLRIVESRTPLLGEGIKVRPLDDASEEPETTARQGSAPAQVDGATISLSDERRAKLIAFVEGNARMPKDAKQRILNQLEQPEVPEDLVARLESRMGG